MRLPDSHNVHNAPPARARDRKEEMKGSSMYNGDASAETRSAVRPSGIDDMFGGGSAWLEYLSS